VKTIVIRYDPYNTQCTKKFEIDSVIRRCGWRLIERAFVLGYSNWGELYANRYYLLGRYHKRFIIICNRRPSGGGTWTWAGRHIRLSLSGIVRTGGRTVSTPGGRTVSTPGGIYRTRSYTIYEKECAQVASLLQQLKSQTWDYTKAASRMPTKGIRELIIDRGPRQCFIAIRQGELPELATLQEYATRRGFTLIPERQAEDWAVGSPQVIVATLNSHQ